MMPFITPEERHDFRQAVTPGQWCYLFYKPMVELWRKNPRWTTADWIYTFRDTPALFLVDAAEILTAEYYEIYVRSGPSALLQERFELAYKVFFELYVMPYEREKQTENGDI